MSNFVNFLYETPMILLIIGCIGIVGILNVFKIILNSLFGKDKYSIEEQIKLNKLKEKMKKEKNVSRL